MTTDELIEKAFKAHEDAPLWQGDPVARDAAIRWHLRGFNDALAVFGEAHAPTSDEREAWRSEAARRYSGDGDLEHREWLRDVFYLGAEFGVLSRLCEVPEPSAERLRARAHYSTAEAHESAQRYLAREPQAEPSDARRLVHEVNMMLSSIASHGPAALTDADDPQYTARLLRRLRDVLDPKPSQIVAAGEAVRAEMARCGLDTFRMIHGQEVANVLAAAALRAARGERPEPVAAPRSAPRPGVLHIKGEHGTLCGVKNPSHVTDGHRYADCADCVAAAGVVGQEGEQNHG